LRHTTNSIVQINEGEIKRRTRGVKETSRQRRVLFIPWQQAFVGSVTERGKAEGDKER